MREKVLALMDSTMGTFDRLVQSVVIERFEDNGAYEYKDLPPQLANLVDSVKAALAENRTALEDAAVAIYAKHFSEEELDVILAFVQSDAGKRYRERVGELQNDLLVATAEWRNAALEPHREKMEAMLGIPQPASVEPDADPPATAA